MPNGLFRLRGEPRLVQVQFGPFSRPISEHEYVAAGYLPLLGDLPWQRSVEEERSRSSGQDQGSRRDF